MQKREGDFQTSCPEHSIQPTLQRSRFSFPHPILLAFALLVGGLLACGGDDGPPPPKPLETVDVDEAPQYDPSNDVQAAPEVPSLTGVLPDDFPQDMPFYLPASLVDYGKAEDGRRFIDLLTPHSYRRVAAALEDLLREAGWNLAPIGPPENLRRTVSKAGKELELHVEDAKPGTTYRFFY